MHGPRIAELMKMPADHERLRRLCVQAVYVLEDLHSPVVAGQAADASARRYREIICGLRAAAKKLSRVADVMEKILRNSGKSTKS